MSNSAVLRSVLLGAALFSALPLVAHAHPGHDDHELTWDFSHLAAHPFATAAWIAALAGLAWLTASAVRSRLDEPKNVRAEKTSDLGV